MDEKFFFAIVEKFNTSDIGELDFSDGNTRLLLKKTGNSAKAAEKFSGAEIIKSPIVATFYSSPGPDAPPFVKPGSKVKTGQTLCILEAMKMMNNLEAEFDCEIIDIHAGGGELVEYGQKLFTVKRI